MQEDLDQQEQNNNNMIKISKNPILNDSRGMFFPLDIKGEWTQSNISVSRLYGTFRGMHHQTGQTSQSKKITVITGKIIDFVVSLREDSFSEAQFFELHPGDTIEIPKNYAHGFLTLEDYTMIQYLVDAPYSPTTEVNIHWTSIPLIKEVIDAECPHVILSDKDSNAVSLSKELHMERTGIQYTLDF